MKKIKKSIDMICMYVMLLHTYIHTYIRFCIQKNVKEVEII